MISLQHVQRQVDAGAVARSRPDRSIDDEDAIRLQPDIRKACLQFVREQPVGGDAPVAQKGGVSKREESWVPTQVGHSLRDERGERQSRAALG